MRYFKKINCIIILLILLFNLLFPIVSSADTIVTIKFEDVNLYNAVVEELDSLSYTYAISLIESRNDTTRTIQMTQPNLESIDALNLYGKNIERLNGLEKFVNLTYLDLHENNITSISNLSSLTKLTNLRIFQNQITNISVLNNFRNLKQLVAYDNQITDISVLSNLRNLSGLYLSNNKITNISNLNVLTNLNELELDSNNITSISSLINLKNLESLSLRYNNIANIDALSSLKSLKDLYLGKNSIENISALRNLTNLTRLVLNDNYIEDISDLSRLTNLEFLDLMNNNITNIDSIRNLTKLTNISIGGNKISDMSVIDSLENVEFNSIYRPHSQKLSITTANKEVELPKIFIQAQNSSSKMYSSSGLNLTNCTLNTTKDKVILNDGTNKAKVKIQAGNIANSTLDITYADNSAPNLNIYYSTEAITKEDVTVRIVANEKIRQVEGWTLSSDGATLTKQYSSNATESVKVYDLAGNEATANISINNIDKVAPQVEISYSTTTATNQNVVVTITANEQIQGVSDWQLSSDNRILTKEFENNNSENIIIKDLAGNEVPTSIVVNNIDKIAPTVEVSYSKTTATNENITVTITASERIEQVEGWNLSADGTTLTKEYSSNATESVKVYDLAGNESTANISINNIDKTAPTVEVTYSTTTATNQDVKVTINSNKPIRKPNGWILSANNQKLEKIFEENYTGTVRIEDLAGNEVIANISINNIDKIAPQVEVNYNKTDLTNENVTVTITANEEIQQVEGWILSTDGTTLTKEYSSNATESVKVYDLAGNEDTANISIDNIDKIAPQVEVSYSTTTATNQNVEVRIIADERIRQIEGWNLSSDGITLTKEYSSNATESVKVYDLAGNETTANISIDNIDKTAPQVEVSYSTTTATNQNVEVRISADERIRQIEGWNLSSDGITLTKEYSSNATESVKIYDLAGNETTANISINNIDKVAPQVEVSYSTTTVTNQNVVVTITANEQIQDVSGWQLSSDNRILTKEFENNNSENITIKDLAGNEVPTSIVVNNIDKIAPTVEVSYSKTTATNENITVTITASERIEQVEGWNVSSDGKSISKTYTSNKAENIKVYDLAGNESTANVIVNNIDKEELVAEVSYSTTAITKENVTVTITTNKELQSINGWQLSSDNSTLTKEFQNNNSENITIKDIAGNTKNLTIKVENIDKTPAEVNINYSNTAITNQNITVIITSNEKIKQVEGWTLSEDGTILSKEYTNNIEEIIKVYDLAGNETKANISINNIDKIAPQIEVKYSTTKLTNEKVKVTITSNKELQELEGWKLSSDKKTLTKDFEDNKDETITIKDIAGNISETTIKVQNIDKKPPTIEVITKTVDGNIIVTIKSNKELQEIEGWIISSDRKTLTKEYKKDAKAEKITIKDLAGNTVTKEIDPSEAIEQTKNPTVQSKTDKTVAPNKLPQTGQSEWIVISITVVIVIIAILVVKYKKYKDIK